MMRPCLGLALALAGCGEGPALTADLPDPAQPGVPDISGFAMQCDVVRGEWRFYLRATAWSGGARLWLTRDGSITELHTFSPAVAARDGSWDCHELELSIAADQREAASGSSTRFRCDDLDALSFRLAISDTDDERWTDCRSFGADPTLLDGAAGAPDCSVALPEADEPGAFDDAILVVGDVADCPG